MISLIKRYGLPVITLISFILIFTWVSHYMAVVIVFVPATLISFVFCWKTWFKKIPDHHSILPIYLLALGIQFIHFTEEYITDFPMQMGALMGGEAYSMDVWIIFNMLAYAIFTWGAIVLYKGLRQWMLIPMLFIVVAVLLNPIGHIAASLYSGGYFSGLYSALIYLIMAPFFLRRIFG